MESIHCKRQLTDLLERTLRQTRFDAGRLGSFSADAMRSMYEEGKSLLDLGAPLIQVVPDATLKELSEKLGQVMHRFVNPETGFIGNGLADLMGGPTDCSVTDFARELATAGATLGPRDAIKMLFCWINGQPLRYQTKALLTGVCVDEPLDLKGGLRIEQLPKRSSEILPFRHAPPSMLGSADSHVELLGSTLLSVDCEALPAFYRPHLAVESPGRTSNAVGRSAKFQGFLLIRSARHCLLPAITPSVAGIAGDSMAIFGNLIGS